jgi:ribosomal protein S18 acetylase RimI-like enzyme
MPLTLPLLLDGTTDLPAGKIASVVTYLEMVAPPAGGFGDPGEVELDLVPTPDVDWYLGLYARIGEPWLWFSRRVMSPIEVRAIIGDPRVDVYVALKGVDEVGLVELDRRVPGEVEIAFFGVLPEVAGSGVGRRMMAAALRLAFATGPRRVWLHTCTLDHPRALAFYRNAGFTAYRRAIEVVDDPRLTGALPATAAPHVPLIGG